NHTAQVGGQLNLLPYTHVRADKVVGSITSLVAVMDANSSGTFLSIPANFAPQPCSGPNSPPPAITTNCLRSADATNWARFYAATLGLLDNVSILAMRDANLNPLPFGTNLENITN